MKGIRVKNFLTAIGLILLCIFSTEEFVREYGFFTYAIQLGVLTITLSRLTNNYVFFLSPTFITYTYLNLSFVFGHYVVSRGIEFDLIYYHTFNQYLSVKYITIIFIIFNFV